MKSCLSAAATHSGVVVNHLVVDHIGGFVTFCLKRRRRRVDQELFSVPRNDATFRFANKVILLCDVHVALARELPEPEPAAV